MRPVIPWVMAAGVAACVGSIDIVGKACPCPAGYVCAGGVCVVGGSPQPPPPHVDGGSPGDGSGPLPDSPGAEGTPCLDVSSDPNNCGACGHSCLGGACSQGACQPVTLATGQPSPYLISLATSATDVYWTLTISQGSAGGNIARCAKTGCNGQPAMLFPDMTHLPQSLVVAGGKLFFVDSAPPDGGFLQAVRSCTPSDCAGTLQTLAVESTATLFLVGDATAVYWFVLGTNDEIQTCPLSGCGGGPTVLGTTSGSFLNGVALDANAIYWLACAAAVPTSCMIMTCNRAGCGNTPSTLVTLAGGSEG